MQPEYQTAPSNETQFFLHKPLLKWFIIGLLFITAFSVRLHHITKPPLDFQPVRQYLLVHHTRSYFYDSLESIPEWKKELARINKDRMGFSLEVPILDHVVVFGYHIMGGENIWIPRVLSSIFWMVGGIFLYLIAEKLFSSGAALFSLIFYLFIPFGISASRSFQPDPLMIMLLLISILMILRYHEQPSLLKLTGAAVVSSLAMLIKPYCIFLIFGAFISIAIHKHGIRKLFKNRDTLIFVLLSPLTGAAYYLPPVFTQGAYLQEHAQVTFLPHLLLEPYFWKDWFAMILRVVGLIAFTGALLGILVIRNKQSRIFMAGLWIGYIIYGLLFTFHMHTHDYYQLQLIPVIALSLGPIGAMAITRLFSSKKGLAILITLMMVLILGIGINIKKAQQRDYNVFFKMFNYVVGTNPQFYVFINEDFEEDLAVSKEIGEIVKHNTNTLLLTSDFGRSLTYHGELSGLPWPTSTSFEERKDRRIINPEKDELFNGSFFTIRTHGKFIQYTPDYFIITDFEEFEKQPDLKGFLHSNYPILAQSKDYLIFDTRKMSKLENGNNNKKS